MHHKVFHREQVGNIGIADFIEELDSFVS